MQSVKWIEPKRLKERGTLGRARSRDHDFIREGKQRDNVVPAVWVRVAA
jgi:hypothetical protein